MSLNDLKLPSFGESGHSYTIAKGDEQDLPDYMMVLYVSFIVASWVTLVVWGIVFNFHVSYGSDESIVRAPPLAVAWIGSLQSAPSLFAASIYGPMFDYGHIPQVLYICLTGLILGIVLGGMKKGFWWVTLFSGICAGSSMGVVFAFSLRLLTTYFAHRSSLSVGIATGSGIMIGTALALTVQRLTAKFGFRWTARGLGLGGAIAFLVLRSQFPSR